MSTGTAIAKAQALSRARARRARRLMLGLGGIGGAVLTRSYAPGHRLVELGFGLAGAVGLALAANEHAAVRRLSR